MTATERARLRRMADLGMPAHHQPCDCRAPVIDVGCPHGLAVHNRLTPSFANALGLLLDALDAAEARVKADRFDLLQEVNQVFCDGFSSSLDLAAMKRMSDCLLEAERDAAQSALDGVMRQNQDAQARVAELSQLWDLHAAKCEHARIATLEAALREAKTIMTTDGLDEMDMLNKMYTVVCQALTAPDRGAA